jgi:hypothetical protein
MSDREVELPNEYIAAGAVFAALSVREGMTVESIDETGETASMVVRFDFLKSPYRITVTMEEEAGDEQHHDGAAGSSA